jgi:hypothetical protein
VEQHAKQTTNLSVASLQSTKTVVCTPDPALLPLQSKSFEASHISPPPRSLPKASAEAPCLSVTANRLDGYACPGFRLMLPSASEYEDKRESADLPTTVVFSQLDTTSRPCASSSRRPFHRLFPTPFPSTRGRLRKQMDPLLHVCSCEDGVDIFGKLPVPVMSLCGARQSQPPATVAGRGTPSDGSPRQPPTPRRFIKVRPLF